MEKTWLTPEDVDERDKSQKENVPFVLPHRRGTGLRFQ